MVCSALVSANEVTLTVHCTCCISACKSDHLWVSEPSQYVTRHSSQLSTAMCERVRVLRPARHIIGHFGDEAKSVAKSHFPQMHCSGSNLIKTVEQFAGIDLD